MLFCSILLVRMVLIKRFKKLTAESAKLVSPSFTQFHRVLVETIYSASFSFKFSRLLLHSTGHQSEHIWPHLCCRAGIYQTDINHSVLSNTQFHPLIHLFVELWPHRKSWHLNCLCDVGRVTLLYFLQCLCEGVSGKTCLTIEDLFQTSPSWIAHNLGRILKVKLWKESPKELWPQALFRTHPFSIIFWYYPTHGSSFSIFAPSIYVFDHL